MAKAQSISINTIVVAAIALIVLVVIIAIFGNKIRDVNSGISDCNTQGGECAPDCTEYGNDNGGLYVNLPGTNCEKNTDGSTKCCAPILKSDN